MRLFLILLCLSFPLFAESLYLSDIPETAIDGKPYPIGEKLEGKTVLIVNIASQCGYTSQMADLEKLYQKYKDRGFVLLGVPTNDFGGQTPEDDKAMLEFCQKNYSATFPILKKGTIVGEKKRELYKFLTERSPKKFQGGVDWNFQKFLVNKKGEVVGRFSSSTRPFDEKITRAIEKNL